MDRSYFEVRFRTAATCWPPEFAILTGYATTGEVWTAAQNEAADVALETELRARGFAPLRITGYSPTTGHAEPGWSAPLEFQDACELGARFLQDAIYYVQGDELFVSHCDERRALIRVGKFRQRLDRT